MKDFIQTGKGEYSEKGKDKLRLQVVKWFIENKKGNIYYISIRYHSSSQWVKGNNP